MTNNEKIIKKMKGKPKKGNARERQGKARTRKYKKSKK